MALHGLESRPEAPDSQPRGSGLEEQPRILRNGPGSVREFRVLAGCSSKPANRPRGLAREYKG